MKIVRIISFFLTACILSLTVCNSVFAIAIDDGNENIEETTLEQSTDFIFGILSDSENEVQPEETMNNEEYGSSNKMGTVYSCVYDSDRQKILVNGSVAHDVFIKHRDYSISLYKISPDQNINTVISDPEIMPLANTAISIKFNFTVSVDKVEDIFSQYVVVLVSQSGEIDYIGTRLYPSVDSRYVAEYDRSLYKGVVVSSDTAIFQSEPTVGVIPVYLDRLISSGSTGYLYSLDNANVFFDREYIDTLDRSIRTLYSSGAKVYLQMLLSSSANTTLNSFEKTGSAMYDIPDLSSISVMNEIYAYCDFLSDRYSSYEKGYISGLIIGKNLDDTVTYNNTNYSNMEDYTEALALYGIVAGVATRKNIPSADISYSFTNANTYSDKYDTSLSYRSSEMIESLSQYFDELYSDDFDFSITLEASHRPLNISNDILTDGIALSAVYDENYIVESNIDVFSEFLDALDKKYSSNPDAFMYIWNVDEGLSGNALSCAYTYLYYKLFGTDRLSSFIVNFDNNPESVYDILNIIKYIDTQKGTEITSQLLHFFREYSWDRVIDGLGTFEFDTREQKLLDKLEQIPAQAIGEFSYFDFSDATSDKLWFAGCGIDSVSIDYNSVIGRSLCAKFDSNSLSGIEYAYLFYSYEYPEIFEFTPYLGCELSIQGEADDPNIFEVKISFESSGDIYEVSQIVYTGEKQNIYFDISDFSAGYIIDNIRISVRPMSEVSGEYLLCLSSLKGQSLVLDDDELKGKIEEERHRIRNSSFETDVSGGSQKRVLTIVAVIVVAAMLGVMLFFFLRRDDTDKI